MKPFEGREVRAVFLDKSKAFDRVWHRFLIVKLRSIGVEENLFNWLISYLSCRKQRAIIKELHSDWRYIEAGVPQRSVLGPLLFLIYINDLPVTISSRCFLFADDCFFAGKSSVSYTGKNNGLPFLDILGYLKNTHKNQVPIRERGWEFPGWNLSHFAKFGIFKGIV